MALADSYSCQTRPIAFCHQLCFLTWNRFLLYHNQESQNTQYPLILGACDSSFANWTSDWVHVPLRRDCLSLLFHKSAGKNTGWKMKYSQEAEEKVKHGNNVKSESRHEERKNSNRKYHVVTDFNLRPLPSSRLHLYKTGHRVSFNNSCV